MHISKQKVNFWKNAPIKTDQFRRKKLSDFYIKKICKLAGDKPTSEIPSRAIAQIINEDLRKDNVLNSKNKPVSIGKSSINNYLNEYLGHPRAIRKAFFL